MVVVAERASRFRADRAFYSGMASAAALAVFFGFSQTFYLRGYLPLPAVAGPLSPLLIVHGVVATLWIGIFLAQTLLVAGGRIDLHRRLGIAGAVVALAMLISGAIVAIDALRRGVEPFGLDPHVWFLGNLLPGIAAFGALVAAAVVLRRKPEAHKRLMLLATLSLLGPAFGRLIAFNFDVTLSGFLLANFALPDAFIVVAVLYDLWRRQRVHPALMIGGGALLALPLLLVAADTSAGLAFADLFR